jgi:hypothetical protein
MGINKKKYGKLILTLPESKATAWYKIGLIDGLGRSAKFFQNMRVCSNKSKKTRMNKRLSRSRID